MNPAITRIVLAAAGLLAPALGSAQVLPAQALPVHVSTSGNVATVDIGVTSLLPIADLTFTFDDASNLSPESLGVSARLVDPGDAVLLSRLSDDSLLRLEGALPLLVTVAAPAAGGLSFRRTGRFELHTHLLPYSLGSNLRVFKAPVGGRFEDVTEEIAQGSVRARSRYSGFSQFLILADLRPTSRVVARKIERLRSRVATLPDVERAPFAAYLDSVDAALDAGDYADALAAVDLLATRAVARAGNGLSDEWRASRDGDNQAGDLLAGAATLKFSIAYLRDYGE